MAFTSVQDLVLQTARKFHLGDVAEASRVTTVFYQALKECFANVVRQPQTLITNVTYRGSTLRLTVANSAVAQELSIRQLSLIDYINDQIGCTVVEEITIKIG